MIFCYMPDCLCYGLTSVAFGFHRTNGYWPLKQSEHSRYPERESGFDNSRFIDFVYFDKPLWLQTMDLFCFCIERHGGE